MINKNLITIVYMSIKQWWFERIVYNSELFCTETGKIHSCSQLIWNLNYIIIHRMLTPVSE